MWSETWWKTIKSNCLTHGEIMNAASQSAQFGSPEKIGALSGAWLGAIENVIQRVIRGEWDPDLIQCLFGGGQDGYSRVVDLQRRLNAMTEPGKRVEEAVPMTPPILDDLEPQALIALDTRNEHLQMPLFLNESEEALNIFPEHSGTHVLFVGERAEQRRVLVQAIKIANQMDKWRRRDGQQVNQLSAHLVNRSLVGDENVKLGRELANIEIARGRRVVGGRPGIYGADELNRLVAGVKEETKRGWKLTDRMVATLDLGSANRDIQIAWKNMCKQHRVLGKSSPYFLLTTVTPLDYITLGRKGWWEKWESQVFFGRNPANHPTTPGDWGGLWQEIWKTMPDLLPWQWLTGEGSGKSLKLVKNWLIKG